jgi:hypothetical protein
MNNCDFEHCVALKLLFEILHEYFVTSNGQKERDVGHKLWAIISSEFIRPEPTAEDLAWADEVIQKLTVAHLSSGIGPDPELGKILNSPKEDKARKDLQNKEGVITKFVWREHGGQIHVDIYSARESDSAFIQNGYLIFQKDEWKALSAHLRRGSLGQEKDNIIILPWEFRDYVSQNK